MSFFSLRSMTSLRALAASLAVAAVAVACGGTSDNSGAGDEEDLTKKSCGPATTLTCIQGWVHSTDGCPAGKARCVKDATGQTCGGIAGLTCPSGYQCNLDGNYPDASGTCAKDPAGQMCGGIAAIQCPTGYFCKPGGSFPDASGTCAKQAPGCLKDVCSDEENCDNTGGQWLDDDPNPQGLYCDCPAGKIWTSGKGCVADEPVPTCLTLTCKAGYHCCSGPATRTPHPASCQPNGTLCPL